MSSNRLYCDVKAGINTCQICMCDCFYPLKIPQPKHKTLNNMALLRCGHGMCYKCYDMMISKKEFSCPWCRNGSLGIMKTFGCSDSRGTMDTLDEFVKEWARFLDKAMTSDHIYARLHRQIIQDYKKERELRCKLKLKTKKEKAKEQIRQQRAKDREAAICKICGKNTFNSTKQLAIHMVKKHKHL